MVPASLFSENSPFCPLGSDWKTLILKSQSLVQLCSESLSVITLNSILILSPFIVANHLPSFISTPVTSTSTSTFTSGLTSTLTSGITGLTSAITTGVTTGAATTGAAITGLTTGATTGETTGATVVTTWAWAAPATNTETPNRKT